MEKVKIVDPDIVKLDRSYVSGIDHNLVKYEEYEDIINSLHTLGKKVVAEGIETQEEFEAAVKLGVDFCQGYYLAMPK